MLQFDRVVVRKGSFALRADFALAAGARVAIIGPSGAGKSTLVEALCGFAPLADGRIVLHGQDITEARPEDRGIAMLFQDGNLFPHLTIAQNVGLGLRPALRLSADEQARVVDALTQVGLEGLGHRKPAALSGGQQSRAALARVLMQDQPVLVLDEPFAALGPALRAEMLDLLQVLLDKTGATLLMVSHSPEDARRIANDVIFVADGAAQAPEPVAKVLDEPAADIRAYLGETARLRE